MKELRHYQKDGIEYARRLGSVLIGDEPGVGKTPQAIMLTKDSPKVLILTMASLKFQFAEEITSWLPEARVITINGSQEARIKQWQGNYQYYVANYELLLRYDWGEMKKTVWDYVIADECTRLSKHTNKQYKALKALMYRRIIPMTGTAISNSPLDCYGVFELVKPGIFKNYYAFVNRYVVKDMWGSPKYYKNLDHLKEIIKPYYIRRTKEQVLSELPPKIQTVIPVELGEKERKLYDQIRAALLFEIERPDVSKVKYLTQIESGIVKLMRLRQLVDSMELIGDGVVSSKLTALKDLLSTLNGGKKIIFSEFASMCEILKRELPHSEMIIGSVDAEARDKIVKKFNTDPDCNILTMSSAGAYGLNLQAADVIIHYDLPWSVGKYEQRAARAHRLGQKNTVYEYSLVARKTVDEFVQKKLEHKQDIAENLMPVTELKEMLTIT